VFYTLLYCADATLNILHIKLQGYKTLSMHIGRDLGWGTKGLQFGGTGLKDVRLSAFKCAYF